MATVEACRSRLHPVAIHAIQIPLKELASLRELSGLNVHAARAASSF